MESIFGTENVARWSNFDPDVSPATADTARIAAAILHAESTVEGRFRGGMYAVPFSASAGTFPAELKTWMAQIAGVYLYKSRGMLDSPAGDTDDRNRVSFNEREAMRGVSAVLAGMRQLNLVRASSGYPTSPVAVGSATAYPVIGLEG